MPRRYEEEINEILHKFDDWPPPPPGRRRGPEQRPNRDPLGSLGSTFSGFSPYQLMGLGLIFILAGAVIHFLGLALTIPLASYATVIGVLILFAGYIMAVAAVRSPRRRTGRSRWRGEVIDLPPRGRGFSYWWWRLTTSFRPRR